MIIKNFVESELQQFRDNCNFTDEELKNISQTGFSILTEIYMKVPTIGMSDEQKEEYKKNLIEQMQGKIKSILSKVELEKKQGKKKSSSLN